MEKRYDDILTSRIEEVSRYGVSKIEDWELRLWYGLQRIGKATYRDLNDRFERMAEADNQKNAILNCYRSVTGAVHLIHSDGLKTMAELAGDA
jgi:hypothetical protein